MAGAADGIRTVVVAKANAAPAAPFRGWLPYPPSLQGQGISPADRRFTRLGQSMSLCA
jgi:hypothetical protein